MNWEWKNDNELYYKNELFGKLGFSDGVLVVRHVGLFQMDIEMDDIDEMLATIMRTAHAVGKEKDGMPLPPPEQD